MHLLSIPAPRPAFALIAAGTALAVLTACSSGSGTGPTVTAGPGTPAPSGSSSTATSTGPPTSSPSVTPVAASAACVQRQLATLSLAERAGQLLMIGVPASNPDDGVRMVTRYRLGGVFLHGRTSASVSAVRDQTDALRAATGDGPGLLVAADQEGGAVQTLSGRGFTDIPRALTQGAWPASQLRARTRSWAAGLADAGVSMDLAPVADTVTAARALNNPPIGRFQREYGHTTAQVSAAVSTVVQAVEEEHVVATVKHFPGLGRVTANTDTSSRAQDGITTAADVYLKPFVAGIQAGAGAVMISSASYPRLDPDAIAAFSQPIITGLLREKLGWDGVVISDDLGKARAVAAVPSGQRATRFVAAGGDLVLSIQPTDARLMRAALVAKAQSSSAFTAQLNASVTRILTLKQKSGLLPC